MRGDPVDLLERTVAALGAMESDQLEKLRDEAEGLRLSPQAAIACARRAAELQQSLSALLQTTEASMRVLRTIRSREETQWEH